MSRLALSRLDRVGTWLSLVEHSLGVRGVGSSNLPVPTIIRIRNLRGLQYTWLTNERSQSRGRPKRCLPRRSVAKFGPICHKNKQIYGRTDGPYDSYARARDRVSQVCCSSYEIFLRNGNPEARGQIAQAFLAFSVLIFRDVIPLRNLPMLSVRAGISCSSNTCSVNSWHLLLVIHFNQVVILVHRVLGRGAI